MLDRCIGPAGIMNGSTRLLVTHQKQFLPLCDRIVLMEDGRIEATGTWAELAEHPTLKNIEEQRMKAVGSSFPILTDVAFAAAAQVLSDSATGNAKDLDIAEEATEERQRTRVIQLDASPPETLARNDTRLAAPCLLGDPLDCSAGKGRLVRAESKAVGSVKTDVYKEYALNIGVLSMTLTIVICAISQGFFFFAEWWVAKWASSSAEDQRDVDWVWMLAVFTGTGVTLHLAGSFAVFILLILGSTRLHGQMIQRLMRAPLAFFHVTPTGRIINGFSRDLGQQDEELPFIFANVLFVSRPRASTICLPKYVPFRTVSWSWVLSSLSALHYPIWPSSLSSSSGFSGRFAAAIS